MTNKAIARILKETADLLELTGSNPFRARAYHQAARTLERLEQPVSALADALTDLPGIGEGLAAQIREILRRGSFDLRDRILDELPPGLLDLLRIKGLGPKKVRTLWKRLGITTLDALEHAAREGTLATLEGFGPRSQASILEQIERHRTYAMWRRMDEVLPFLEALVTTLSGQPEIVQVAITGAARRCMETVDRAEVVIATSEPSSVADTLEQVAFLYEQVETETGQVLRGLLPDALPFAAHLVAPSSFGTILWQTTGATSHVEAFLERFGTPPDLPDEQALYERVGLPFIPPELREGQDELDAAAAGRLPDLITREHLHGTLHNHSTYSDGADTLEAMARAAYEAGYAYFGICDHSRSLKVAHGLSVEDVLRQHREIDRLNAGYAGAARPFRIFKGIESDILEDGSLDYPPDVLASFELVVASIHSGFNMTRDEATRRLIKAIENPFTTILGHPTGRLLLRREGYPVDLDAVLDACAANGVALELNANPYRLDLDWRWVRKAIDRGIWIAINPDAHAVDQLDLIRYGVAVARKGWLTPERCLNALSLEGFRRWLALPRPERLAFRRT
ncbi:MAG: DNA polymerase/3'-5' exonuclease PolX [Bacteroidetes bacterium]|nr:MAG: DNA polymerase/3'-5' exonuclease PolX [Bacteroidota bacterium]